MLSTCFFISFGLMCWQSEPPELGQAGPSHPKLCTSGLKTQKVKVLWTSLYPLTGIAKHMSPSILILSFFLMQYGSFLLSWNSIHKTSKKLFIPRVLLGLR